MQLPRAADVVHQAHGEPLAGVGHLHAVAHAAQFDQLPLNPGCQYPMTIQPGRGAVCDVPITLAPDVSENAWYVTRACSVTAATFNGIWEAPWACR